MTAHKHLKQLVRARMQKTGESFATARRHIIRSVEPQHDDFMTRWHFPGSVPATIALRVLLAQAGVRDPHTGEPFWELHAIRHRRRHRRWCVLILLRARGCCDILYRRPASVARRSGLPTRHAGALRHRVACSGVGRGAGGRATAARRARAQRADAVAWVDLAELPHRAMPSAWSGGGYHVITIYGIEDGVAQIGDLTDEPISISLPDLARARARIKKQRHRLLQPFPRRTRRIWATW